MKRTVRSRGEDIRAFILKNIGKPHLSTLVTEKFAITRQAANRHLQNLADEHCIVADGNTRGRTYRIASAAFVSFQYEMKAGLEEDAVWRADIRPFFESLPNNVLEIWHYSFTEMFNNAIDHSGGKTIRVSVHKTAVDAEISIADDGVGIFTKIQTELNLPDERQAIFELSKGKLTTDTRNHSGQGIFFTSRMVNNFDIFSGGVYFGHEIGREFDWLSERKTYQSGTTILLRVENHTSRSVRKVNADFSTKGTYSFSKTIVPVKLAKYGTDQLVSRSQAKRVLVRVDLFAKVILDFSDVETIGQAFSDQIFRVFASEHPEVELTSVHANTEVLGIINATIKSGRPGFKGTLPN